MLESNPKADGMSLDGPAYAGSRLYRTDLPGLSAKNAASLNTKAANTKAANTTAALARGNPFRTTHTSIGKAKGDDQI